MTENYTPPATWQRWADEGGTMAILTVQESADMLKRMAERVIDDNRSQPLYPSYARAILDVLAALATVTAERDELKTWKSTVPVTAIRGVFITAWYEGDTDIEVRAWLKAQGERVPE